MQRGPRAARSEAPSWVCPGLSALRRRRAVKAIGRAVGNAGGGLLPGHANGVGQAVAVGLDGLEGVVADGVGVLLAPVVVLAVAVRLADAPGIEPGDLAEKLEALVDEHVFPPLPEVQALHARLRSQPVGGALVVIGECLDRARAEDLEGAVQAILAVADVPRAARADEGAQPVRKEHGVRVGFNGPAVRAVEPVLDHLLPHRNENPRVQSGLRVAAVPAFQGAVHDRYLDPPDRHRGVAVDPRLVAGEDAGLLVSLELEQRRLIAGRHHESVAEHRAADA
mmetsp:Transcript_83127/g.235796  ORF Transcript_83127/g.235796 Transcript_83127/m.235796 type:complete len:281 (-) Transcript_83127:128-970(-)